MPVLAITYTSLTATGESELGPSCPSCGSANVEFLAGYYSTGVTGPNEEPETHWREAMRCRDCNEIEEF
jgi:hypothetical protein